MNKLDRFFAEFATDLQALGVRNRNAFVAVNDAARAEIIARLRVRQQARDDILKEIDTQNFTQ